MSNNDILLQNYILACKRLNQLARQIDEAKAEIAEGTDTDTTAHFLAGYEQEYYSVMTYCDQLVAHFAKQSLDINALAEAVA